MSGSPGPGRSDRPIGSSQAGSFKPGRPQLLPALLSPLVPAYAAALAAKNTAYARGWMSIQKLQAPVISVGNLSVGGAGKTPLVIRLAELLSARGYAVDVLSRGYGRRSKNTEQVRLAVPDEASSRDHEGPRDDAGGDDSACPGGAAGPGSPVSNDAAALYGDEPLLIARVSGVPVYVGARRYAAGLLAEQRVTTRPRVHLLDDGFQHRQLARAVDVVVLHRSDFSAALLPAGRLREPLSALRRASIVVLRAEDADLEPQLHDHFPGLIVWIVTRELTLPPSAAGGVGRAIAFCGIAHPQEFFEALSRAGVDLAGTHAFRDHHVFTNADVDVLKRSVRASGARILLATEKDLARLSAAQQAALAEAAEVRAIPLRVRLLEEEQAMRQLIKLAGLASVDQPGVAETKPTFTETEPEPRF